MKGQGSYAPPAYIPLGQSESETEIVPGNELPLHCHTSESPAQWSSGICACCDDMQSCCVGLFCPCFLFGKNAEFLGSGTLVGSCMTHFILCGLVNALCCLLTEGILLGLPGCVVACYACGYRRSLRSKYNLQEAPCGDLTTHMFCHIHCSTCPDNGISSPGMTTVQLRSRKDIQVQDFEAVSGLLGKQCSLVIDLYETWVN
ncbi:hypothetical protein NE237_005179 [Protea cynaroides]|uniref:Uncharacterized protein n=1 Tax=Protea cynaroides TaxID=273540 RepID=A0A9Q0KKD1_9MAGN|nr:hypothetical protein NE237_005179 [Protea cynaroides]